MNKKIAKKDYIQSFDVVAPVDTSRGSYIGHVCKVEVDPTDGVEYVYFVAEMRVENGLVERVNDRDMRAPQNGTKTSSGRVIDGIHVIPHEAL